VMFPIVLALDGFDAFLAVIRSLFMDSRINKPVFFKKVLVLAQMSPQNLNLDRCHYISSIAYRLTPPNVNYIPKLDGLKSCI